MIAKRSLVQKGFNLFDGVVGDLCLVIGVLKPSLEGGNKRLATGGCCASERQEVSESLRVIELEFPLY